MINNIFFITLLTLPMFTYANYEMHMPLEVQNRGHLDQNTIIFNKKETPIPEIKYDITCKMIIGAGASHWRMAPGTPVGNLYWNGALLAKSIPVDQSYINAEGVIYKRGAFLMNQGLYDWYELCQYIEKK
jgi:hypothetical protein